MVTLSMQFPAVMVSVTLIPSRFGDVGQQRGHMLARLYPIISNVALPFEVSDAFKLGCEERADTSWVSVNVYLNWNIKRVIYFGV